MIVSLAAVLFILALVCFGLSAVGVASRVNFQGFGLFFLTGALFLSEGALRQR